LSPLSTWKGRHTELCSLILTRGRDLLLIIALKANATSAGQQREHKLNWMNFYRLYSQAVKIFCRQLSQSCLYRLGRITVPMSTCAAFQSESNLDGAEERHGNSI
jgi:hypothetical protein